MATGGLLRRRIVTMEPEDRKTACCNREMSAASSLHLTRRFIQLLVGLFVCGIAIASMIRAELGVAPWDVLGLGIQKQTGWNFGFITVLISAVVLLLWIPIRQRPGLGTILNALLIGPSADIGLSFIPRTDDLLLRSGYLVGGVVLMAIGTGLYIGAHFGPGPRDGLMTGLTRRLGWPIWVVRTGIEVVVLAIGWSLGGLVGVGTVLFALAIGPLCNITIPLFSMKIADPPELARELGGDVPPSNVPGDTPAI